MGNITNDKIKKYIDEYLSEGYGDRVKTRCWDNMYIHMPQTKRFIDGVPTCSIWKRVVFEKKKEFLAIKDFDKLYEQLKLLKRTNKIEGIGDLIIYDTATCLGCPNNVFPSSIYIHAGVAKGLVALFDKQRFGSKLNPKKLTDKYPAFNTLEPIQIEDFLCIYHNDLEGNEEKGKKARKFVQINSRKSCCCSCL